VIDINTSNTACIFNNNIICEAKQNCATYTFPDNITDEELRFTKKIISKNKKDGFPIVGDILLYDRFMQPNLIVKAIICTNYRPMTVIPMSPAQKFR